MPMRLSWWPFVALMLVKLCALAVILPASAAPTNLHPNPGLSGTAGWYLVGTTVSNTTRGSGQSLALKQGNTAYGPYIRITPGKTYTCGGYVMGFTSPTDYIRLSLAVYNSAGAWVRNTPGASDYAYVKPGQWQEAAVIHQALADEKWFRLLVSRAVALDGTQPMFLDDVYCYEGVGLEGVPSAKQAFTGGITRIGSNGQVSIKQANGTFQATFLKCMYMLSNETSWKHYAQNGWNCNMWARSVAQVQKATQAGIPYSFLDVTPYIARGSSLYNRLDLLEQDIRAILNSAYAQNLVGYYYDNESALDIVVATSVLSRVKQLDTQGGTRQRPIYILQGNPGRSVAYVTLSDVVGGYVQSGLQTSLQLLELIPGQTKPVMFGVLQELSTKTAAQMRTNVFNVIHPAKGSATAISFWHTHPITQDAWYPAFPAIAADAGRCVLQGLCP